MKRALLLGCFLLFAGGLARAADELAVAAHAEVRPSTTVPVAEPAEILLTFSSRQKLILSSAALPAGDDFQILGSKTAPPRQASNGRWESALSIQFMPLNQGALTFPSLSIPFLTESQKAGSAQTPPVKIAAVNALGSQAAQEMLKDIKGPLGAAWNPWPSAVLLALVLIVLAVWLVWKRRKPAGAQAPAGPPRPAHEVALEGLEKILADYQRDGEVKAFYTGLSLILREYLSRLYRMDAVEKTTAEIFSDLRRRGLDRKLCLRCKEILDNCDLVKFAKFSPPEKQAEEDWGRGKALVQDTRPPEAPPAAEAAGKAVRRA